jgi:hypothetical protein
VLMLVLLHCCLPHHALPAISCQQHRFDHGALVCGRVGEDSAAAVGCWCTDASLEAQQRSVSVGRQVLKLIQAQQHMQVHLRHLVFYCVHHH